MDVFKPDVSKIFPPDVNGRDREYCGDLGQDDDFFNNSHGENGEFTVCGVACEEWNYDNKLPRKKITCPNCLSVIKLCKSYTL